MLGHRYIRRKTWGLPIIKRAKPSKTRLDAFYATFHPPILTIRNPKVFLW